jgi:beta-mannosidase
VTRHAVTEFVLVATSPHAAATPRDVPWRDGIPARVPGTAAAALHAAGAWRYGDRRRFDDQDWWWRTQLAVAPAAGDEQLLLHLGGVATISEVWINGERVGEANNMHLAQTLDVTRHLHGTDELVVCCRALTPRLRERMPRPRWRTRLVADQGLRYWRTAISGRAPGIAPAPSIVGPWRAVEVERVTTGSVTSHQLAAAVRPDGAGEVSVQVTVRSSQARLVVRRQDAEHQADLSVTSGAADARVVIDDPVLWWPHTHGDPALYDVLVETPLRTSLLGRVGFRRVTATGDDRDDLALRVNDAALFCRGAVWMTPLLDPDPDPGTLRRLVGQARHAGMNMLRIPGTGTYPSDAFLTVCDELGLLVWLDLMFASMDYPTGDEAFRRLVDAEIDQVSRLVAAHPSVIVVCGNCEVRQQAAMIGLERSAADNALFDDVLAERFASSTRGVAYLSSSPCGDADQPFRSSGVSHWFGVGAYRRDVRDARCADVRFASECLAFANIPDDAMVQAFTDGQPPLHSPAWKAGVPRDNAAGWDFDDVRDHYFPVVFGLDPTETRWADPERYLDLSRVVTGEMMARVVGEWRRNASACHGALILALNDHQPGAGWGVIDADGSPKAAYWYLARAFASTAIWMTDEGLDGVSVHIANDAATTLHSMLRVAVYRADDTRLSEARIPVVVAPRSVAEHAVEAVLGRFIDAAYAYRFGPPGHRLVVATLEHDADAAATAQAFWFVGPHPAVTHPIASRGLAATIASCAHDGVVIDVVAERLVYAASIEAAGFVPSDNWFCLEPARPRRITLTGTADDAVFDTATLTAVNVDGRLRIHAADSQPVRDAT